MSESADLVEDAPDLVDLFVAAGVVYAVELVAGLDPVFAAYSASASYASEQQLVSAVQQQPVVAVAVGRFQSQ